MSQLNNTTWVTKHFSALSVAEVYEMLRLRSDVFVVEQHCIFLDADNNDQKAYHVLGYVNGELIATTRLFDKDIVYNGYQSIGRVANAAKYRGMGIGKKLMQYSIEQCEQFIRSYGNIIQTFKPSISSCKLTSIIRSQL